MAKNPQNGKSEDMAGLGSILSSMAEREKAGKTRAKIDTINKRSYEHHWERERSSLLDGKIPELEGSDGPSKKSDRPPKGTDHSVGPSDQRDRPLVHTPGTHLPSIDNETEGLYSLADYKIKTKVTPLDVLARTLLRKRLLFSLLQEGHQITSYANISKELDITKVAARRALEHFERQGFLKKEPIRRADIQGLQITILASAEEQERTLKELSTHLGTDPGTHPIKDKTPPSLERKIDKDTSILEKLQAWTDKQMAEWFPALHAAGFKRQNLQQVIDSLDGRNKTLDLIPVSLEYAEWELSNQKMKDKDGKPVGSPASYVFSALVKQGHYRRPKDYIDPQEKALQEEKARLEALQKEKEVLDEKAFQVWRDSLSPEQRSQYEKDRTSSQFPVPEEIFLRNAWRQAREDNPI